MSADVFIRREPVVNRNRTITASRLIVYAPSSAAAAEALNELSDTWPTARSVLVSLAGVHPDEDLGAWQAPSNVMLEIPAAGLDDPAVQALIARCVDSEMPLCLDGYLPGMTLPAAAQFRFLLADVRRAPKVVDAPGLLLAKELRDASSFEAAVSGGYAGAAGWFFLHNLPVTNKLNPAHAQIVRVLSLVRNNAAVREIETALKFDVTLSYKLLRYINSAGFGLSCEIQSFRHAVTILGYEKLNRWLSLLLVTASKDPAAPALMQTAIARGRFMELVGKSFFDRTQLDNLFITGTFSLLDILLGANLKAALDELHLPEAINNALLNREGIFAPFLELALACEQSDVATLAALAGQLELDATVVNHAQIEALAFADSLQFN
jgi:hypothetical protein